MAEDILKKFVVLDSINSKPIHLYIDSPGGGCSDGFAIIDMLPRIKSKVYTYILGEACSMAGVISVCGDKRFMGKNSQWMGHSVSGGIDRGESLHLMKTRLKSINQAMDNIISIIESKTKLSKSDIKKILYNELWLDAEGCLKKGVVDKLI
jgi:ATP-dependent Clp protease protease subunit